MKDSRYISSWLLLALVVVVAGGAAALAVNESPSLPSAGLVFAAENTQAATSYTENLTQTSATSGSQTLHLVYQAPDRYAGYEQSGARRVYLVADGNTVYETAVTSITASISTLHFYVIHTSGVAGQLDPLPSIVAAAKQTETMHKNGLVYGFGLTSSGGSALYRYTVAGEYLSSVVAVSSGGSARITFSRVNSSPLVQLPRASSLLPGSPPTSSGG